ncbi:MAG TPA: hypothetical protein DIW67_21895 [Pseudomonas sp.]|uniref:hypothetical protein n=1 Tax=Pseudomonas sp. TaxID=306 RepID=UPI000EDEA746|nr:hypothetical protein [Pseudomonas sp.]HCS09753.1 hypothetical protein [Pseudomonas sp.]
MAIQRVKKCTLCTTEFNTSQIKAKYCPDCRPRKARIKTQSDRRFKTAQNRIERLPQSEEWLWVARECRRAGTVEILQGVDLVALFAVYKSKFKTYGYDSESKKSKFHICHIAPVAGKDSVGLLHHLNLFIGSAFHNQVHSNQSYPDRGLFISNEKLKRKWKVEGNNSDRTILSKVQQYLGQTLIDYAKDNPISTATRFGLARWVFQNDPDNILQLKKLEIMSARELRAIKAKVEGKEVYNLSYPAKRSFVVMLEECQRLSEQLPDGQHKEDIAFMTSVLLVAIAWLSRLRGQEGLSNILEKPYGVKWTPLKLREGMDVSKLRDFVGFQSFQALQGAPVDRMMIRNTLNKYLAVTSLSPDYSASNSSMQRHFSEEYSRFVMQVPLVKNAIISLGLPDKVMLAEELTKVEEAAKEEAVYTSFGYEQCEGPLDYSTIHYEIEDDYIPNPNLRTVTEEVFVDF